MSTKSYVFLTPATQDKAGECVELEYESEPLQYLEPFAANDDLGKLRANVHEARAKLQHAKSRGKGVAEAQKAFETAKSALDKGMHLQQKQERQRQRIGGDHPFAPQSEDKRVFAEVVDYSVDNVDEGDYADDLSDDELEAAIVKAVADLETAQSNGATPTEMLRLEQALKVLREKLPNPSAPPKNTTAAPPRRSHIERPAPTQGPAGQAARQAGWPKFLANLDARLAKRRKALQATHSTDVCCEGAYKCAKCRAKAPV